MRILSLAWLLLGLWLQDKPGSETLVQEDVVSASEAISPDKLKDYAAYIASDELEGRLAGFPGNQKAAEYIEKRLKEFGFLPLGDKAAEGGRSFFQKFHPDRAGELNTQNIVAWIKGDDEGLCKECVVIGAHYDHLGTADQKPGAQFRMGKSVEGDKIWNGADDNGSGTVTLLEVARAFAALKGKTRRSVVFVWFSAEEWGLLGSRYFVKHPPEEFPVSQIAAMINLDMVGRNATRPCGIYGLGTEKGEMFEKFAKRAVEISKLDARMIKASGSGSGDSDHTSFRKEGVPVIFFFTGAHSDYHRVTDHVDKLCFDNMARVGRTAMILTAALANAADRPAFDPESNKAHASGSVKMKFRLGVMPDYQGPEEAALDKLGLGKDEGVLAIESVNAGSVGEKAGLKPGDLIAAIAGEALPRKDPIVKYMELLNTKVKAFEPCEIVVLRKGERMKLRACWGGRLGVSVNGDGWDDETCDKFGLAKDEGALPVTGVESGGVAEKSGIKAGDAIVSIGGDKLPRQDPMARLTEVMDTRVKPGEPIEVVVVRKGERLKLKAVWEK